MRGLSFRYIPIAVLVSLSLSCSTVRVVPEGKSALKENKIVVLNSESVKPAQLNPYLRQQPNNSFLFGFNPFLIIYNWSNNKDNAWDRFVKRIGQPPVILDTFLVQRSRENLLNHLRSAGYYSSTVTDSIFTKGKRSRVSYFITVGNRYTINNINYIVRDTSIDRFVKQSSGLSLIKPGQFLSEKLLDLESERVTAVLRENGYYNFSKNYFFFVADTLAGNGKADLLVTIENHTRNETPKDARLHRQYRIRKISLYPDYDPMRLREDSLAASKIVPMRDFNIYYRGDKISIKPSTLEKLNTLKPGELYNEKKATNTYNRLVSLRYFSGVNIQFDEVDGQENRESGEVDCVIRLTPSKSQGYKLNLEASSNSNNLLGVSPAASYYHKNLFKGGEWFTLGFMGNFQFKLNDPIKSTELGISSSISFPSFLMLPDSIFKTNVPRTDISVGYNYQNRPEFTRNLISFNYGYNWRSGDRLFYFVNPIQLNIIRLFNMNTQFYDSMTDPFLRNAYRNHFDLGSGATIYYTTDASVIPKKSFFYARWTNDIAGNLLSAFNKSLPSDTTGAKMVWNTPYAQYIRSEFTLGYTWKPQPSMAVATRFNIGVGYAYGNSGSLPFEKLFYVGGANSMRGWQARSLGPGSAPVDTTFSIPNQTGDLKIEANIEYRFSMFWKVEGALFADAGNVWTLRSERGRESGLFRFSDFYKSVALNWGLGARLNLDFVILRLDLGMIAHDPYRKVWIGPSKWFRENTYSLQFGVNYPF